MNFFQISFSVLIDHMCFYGLGGDVNKVPRIGFPPVVSLINNSFCDNSLPIVKKIWAPSENEV